MFEAIALSSRSAPGRDFQIGELAESLLYYGTVHLVGNGGLIAGLSTSIGTLQTLELIERGYLRIHFEKQMLGIQTNTDTNGRQFHDIVKFGAVDQEPKDFIRNALEKAGWERYQAKTMASRFAKKVEEYDYPDYNGAWAKSSFLDQRFVRAVIPKYFEQFGASDSLPNDFKFEVSEDASGLVTSTNIDLQQATIAFRKAYGLKTDEVTPALILDTLRQVSDQQYIGASLSSEVHASPLVMAGSSVRLSEAVESASRSRQQIDLFQDFVFEGVGSIDWALTSGKRTFDDFLEVLRRAEKFRSWIATQQPNSDLLKEYHRSIAEKTFLEKSPGKSTRFAFFAGGGLLADALITGGVGTTIGLALSAADTFLMEKLGLGWKPHHFVTGKLREFVVEEK